MADDIDMAQNNTERYLASAIRGITKTMAADPVTQERLDCEECGDEIPYKRRMAVPWTKLCINCAETAERTARGR